MNDPVICHPPFPKNYADSFLQIEKGEGVYLEDSAGKKYLDFGSGIAVNALGYGRRDLAEIAREQMEKLIHISNLYTTAPAVRLAETLTAAGNFAAVHFGNSGAEANEAALKYARLYSLRTKGEGHHKLLSFSKGFHGRTMGALSVTATEKYKAPFAPLLPGCETIAYDDAEQLAALAEPERYAAVIVEVIQGEGGLRSLSPETAAALNAFCRANDVILIADEVQTGVGRTGEIFASTGAGLEPDIITLSKPLAAGLPLSATLIPDKINRLLRPGDHGTTFGGGPVTTAVAQRAWEVLTEPGFLDGVRRKGRRLRQLLREELDRSGLAGEIRGAGLLCGLVLRDLPAEKLPVLLETCRRKGLLLLRSGQDVIRMAPPLVIEEEDLEKGAAILFDALKEIER